VTSSWFFLSTCCTVNHTSKYIGFGGKWRCSSLQKRMCGRSELHHIFYAIYWCILYFIHYNSTNSVIQF